MRVPNEKLFLGTLGRPFAGARAATKAIDAFESFLEGLYLPLVIEFLALCFLEQLERKFHLFEGALEVGNNFLNMIDGAGDGRSPDKSFR